MTTESTHVVTARIVNAGGDIPLSIVSRGAGGVTLDAGRIPHVEAQLIVAVPDPLLLEKLDPRQSRRVIITVAATFPSFTRQRTFNLGIRRAIPDRAAGTVTLRLSSDEALLQDKAQMLDDSTPRSLQSSLRAVCNYVLSKIGTALAVGGGPEADVTAYWRVSNILANPSFEVDLTGWTAGTGALNLRRSNSATPVAGAWTALYTTNGVGSTYIDHANVSVTPGRPVVFSVYMVATASRPARVMVRFKNAAGVAIRDVYSAPVQLGTLTWARVSAVGLIPPAGATQASLHIEYQSDIANRSVFIDCCMFYEGTELIPYVDGSLPADLNYTYAWSGTAHASTSTRTPIVERPPESLIWSAGVSGMDFLEPLLKAAGLRLVCDEQRRWTLRSADFRADGNQTYRHAANIETADEELSREDEDWYDGAVYVYIWTDRDGIEQRRVDAYAMPGATKIILREIRDTPYPGPGRAQHMVERAQSRGRTVTVSAIPTWQEQTDQTLSVLLEGTAIQTGTAGTVRFDFATDTVTVTSRTADTDADAWVLVPDLERWLDAPVNDTWIGS